jgi:hypothetical protein
MQGYIVKPMTAAELTVAHLDPPGGQPEENRTDARRTGDELTMVFSVLRCQHIVHLSANSR